MEDIFQWCRDGNALQVRVWLDDTEHDMNQGDDHGFSPMHWASKRGHIKIVELLLARGAQPHLTNMGDDTPLHLAAAHNHRDIVALLLQQPGIDVNSCNEHGNTPLHYACFWGYGDIAEMLVRAGTLVGVVNRDGHTPLERGGGALGARLLDIAASIGADTARVQTRSQSWRNTRSRDNTLSRHRGIRLQDLALTTRLAITPTGETWRGRWQKADVVAKILAIRECSPRVQRDFNEEFPKLRIFSHPNILPVIGCCVSPPSLVVISQYMPRGSLYSLLHEGRGAVVVDRETALRAARGVARGMHYLHDLPNGRAPPPLHLTSKHIMMDEDMTARINMADAQFSFLCRGREYSPAWRSPESLSKPPSAINLEAAHMWSFGILLWELSTRQVPHGGLSPMEAGLRIATEGLTPPPAPGAPPHLQRLTALCLSPAPAKRPAFHMITPILDKMTAPPSSPS